ncbi:MAG: hypothetical protein AAGM38_01875 [Pseudomonadota bacterium]
MKYFGLVAIFLALSVSAAQSQSRLGYSIPDDYAPMPRSAFGKDVEVYTDFNQRVTERSCETASVTIVVPPNFAQEQGRGINYSKFIWGVGVIVNDFIKGEGWGGEEALAEACGGGAVRRIEFTTRTSDLVLAEHRVDVARWTGNSNDPAIVSDRTFAALRENAFEEVDFEALIARLASSAVMTRIWETGSAGGLVGADGLIGVWAQYVHSYEFTCFRQTPSGLRPSETRKLRQEKDAAVVWERRVVEQSYNGNRLEYVDSRAVLHPKFANVYAAWREGEFGPLFGRMGVEHDRLSRDLSLVIKRVKCVHPKLKRFEDQLLKAALEARDYQWRR